MARQKKRHRRSVVDVLGEHRLDEAQVVGYRTDVRQPFANSRAALAPAAEFRLGRHDELLLLSGHQRQPLTLPNGLGQFHAGPLFEAGLFIVQLDLRRSTGLREEDHAFGLRGKVRQAEQSAGVWSRRGSGIGRLGAVPRKGHGSDGEAGSLTEEITSSGCQLV